MSSVTVRGVTLGEGRPKIIVPLMGATEDALLREAASVAAPVDLAEWRVDWFADAADFAAVTACAAALRAALGEVPLLATFRTSREGGKGSVTPNGYAALCTALIGSGAIDLLDVEVLAWVGRAPQLIAAAHRAGVRVIASSHDFERTPSRRTLLRRLARMRELGADIAKIAVMPRCPADVLTLLAATEKFCRDAGNPPVITMSMGKAGVLSRVAGETFGSCATFGALQSASAPGQLGVETLDAVLTALH